jgi:prophage regulatory protein
MTEQTVSPDQDSAAARKLLTQRDIIARGSFSRSHLYNLIARNQFPAPCVRCGPRFTRWDSESVDAWFEDPAGWIAARASEASNV